MSVASQVWDPYTILNIDRSRTMCYGKAPSKGRDCHKSTAFANHEKAHSLLAEISERDPSSENIVVQLRIIAGCLICRYSNHQDQIPSVVRRWQRSIRVHLESIAELQDEEQSEEEVEDNAASEGGQQHMDFGVQLAEVQRLCAAMEASLAAHLDAQGRSNSTVTQSHTDTIPGQGFQGPEAFGSITDQSDNVHDGYSSATLSSLTVDGVEAPSRSVTLEAESNERHGSSIAQTLAFEHDTTPVFASASVGEIVSEGTVSNNLNVEIRISEGEQDSSEETATTVTVRGGSHNSNHVNDGLAEGQDMKITTIGRLRRAARRDSDLSGAEQDNSTVAGSTHRTDATPWVYMRLLDLEHLQQLDHQRVVNPASPAKTGQCLLGILALILLYISILFLTLAAPRLQFYQTGLLHLDGSLARRPSTLAKPLTFGELMIPSSGSF